MCVNGYLSETDVWTAKTVLPVGITVSGAPGQLVSAQLYPPMNCHFPQSSVTPALPAVMRLDNTQVAGELPEYSPRVNRTFHIAWQCSGPLAWGSELQSTILQLNGMMTNDKQIDGN